MIGSEEHRVEETAKTDSAAAVVAAGKRDS